MYSTHCSVFCSGDGEEEGECKLQSGCWGTRSSVEVILLWHHHHHNHHRHHHYHHRHCHHNHCLEGPFLVLGFSYFQQGLQILEVGISASSHHSLLLCHDPRQKFKLQRGWCGGSQPFSPRTSCGLKRLHLCHHQTKTLTHGHVEMIFFTFFNTTELALGPFKFISMFDLVFERMLSLNVSQILPLFS